MNVICFAIVSLFFVRGASAGSSENATLVDRSTPDLGEDSSVIRRKWISEVMAEVEMTFNMHINVSSECRRDFEIYRLHAKNQTVWAIRMMESTEWPKIGLFSGVTTHLGNYAECLRSRGPGIAGQYCLAQATYDFTVSSIDQLVPGWTDWPEENASAWKVIKMHEKNPLRRSRRSLTWAMCIPSSCTAADLQTSLSNVLRPAFKAQHFDIATHVKPAFCTVEEVLHRQKFLDPKRFPAMFMLLVVGTSTIYTWIFGRNQVTEKDRLSVKLVKCFSAVQNYKALYQSSSRTYPFLYFLKIVFMFFIIGAHAVIFYSMFPNYETEQLEVLVETSEHINFKPVLPGENLKNPPPARYKNPPLKKLCYFLLHYQNTKYSAPLINVAT